MRNTLHTTKKNKNFFLIFILVFLFYFHLISINGANAYSLDVPSGPVKSIFNKNPFQFAPIDINKFVGKDRFGLTFTDLSNAKGFSSKDIGASVKAVLILFIRLIVTTLNVTLGILKALLEVLTRVL